jgi:hypothetical protein
MQRMLQNSLKLPWQRLASAGLLPFLWFCAADSNMQIAAAPNISFIGTLDLAGTNLSIDKLKFQVIDPEGQRRLVTDLAVDPATNSFRASIPETLVHAGIGGSLPEQIGAMGETPPQSLNSTKGFSYGNIGFIRLEILPKEEPVTESGIFLYHQTLFAVPRAVTMNANRAIVVHSNSEAGLKLYNVGRKLIRVPLTDDATKMQFFALSFLGNTVAPSWSAPQIAPAYSTGIDGGYAVVFPIGLDDAEPKYQVGVIQPEQCPILSSPRIFEPSNKEEHTLELSACSSPDLSKDQPEFSGDFSKGIRKKIMVNDDVDTEFGLVSSFRVPLTLQSPNYALRGIEAYVYEGRSPSGAVVSEAHFDTFRNDVVVEVPRRFSSTGSENGEFVIAIRPRYRPSDVRRFGQAKFVYLYGIRSVTTPSIDASTVVIESAAGKPGIVSGQSGVPFTIKEARCPADGDIGFL